MKVYTEYQVKELLRSQREICAQMLESRNSGKDLDDDCLAESLRRAQEPVFKPSLEVYIAQEMKRSFEAGFGTGFDARSKHSKEEAIGDKLACLNYLDEFTKWFTAYNKRKDGTGYAYQKEKTLSK